MQSLKNLSFVLLLALVGSLLAVIVLAPPAVQANNRQQANHKRDQPAGDQECEGTNLLANPSFEGDYTSYILPPPGHPDCGGVVCERAQMAADWHPWWRTEPRNEPWMNIMPEYKQATLANVNPDRVRSGEAAQQYFSFWSTHEAGMYQQVAAQPGVAYCFSVWGHSWSALTSSDFYSDPDPDNGDLMQRIGLDPTGGTDWQSPHIIWGEAREQYDFYGLFRLEVVAEATTITVFTHSTPAIPVKHNDVYWDDAILTAAIQPNLTVPSNLTVLADVDTPALFTRTLPIQLTGYETITWTAALEPGATITPTLNPTSGPAGQSLTITLNSAGLLTGTYSATLTITSDPAVPGSPATVLIQLLVLSDVRHIYLPDIYWTSLSQE